MSTTQSIPPVKLVPHGNAFALVFAPEVLRQLGIDENTPLNVTSNGHALVVTRATTGPGPAQLQKTLEQVNAEWGPVLKKLAE